MKEENGQRKERGKRKGGKEEENRQNGRMNRKYQSTRKRPRAYVHGPG